LYKALKTSIPTPTADERQLLEDIDNIKRDLLKTVRTKARLSNSIIPAPEESKKMLDDIDEDFQVEKEIFRPSINDENSSEEDFTEDYEGSSPAASDKQQEHSFNEGGGEVSADEQETIKNQRSSPSAAFASAKQEKICESQMNVRENQMNVRENQMNVRENQMNVRENQMNVRENQMNLREDRMN
jgi:hypothetical protein